MTCSDAGAGEGNRTPDLLITSETDVRESCHSFHLLRGVKPLVNGPRGVRSSCSAIIPGLPSISVEMRDE